MDTNTIGDTPIKALSLDLDGTCLLPGAVLSERCARVLRSCLDRGLRLILNTGRSADSAEPYREALGAEGLMVYFNGALVMDMPGRRPVRERFLDRDVVDYCVELSRGRDLYFQCYFQGRGESAREFLMTERPGDPNAEFYRGHTKIRAAGGDLRAAMREPGILGCLKCMFITEPQAHDYLRAVLTERFGDRLYITRSSDTFLEVLDGAASKGAGLAAVMERYGLGRDQVMAFGDEENDLPMFGVAGRSAAPASAKDAVRRAATVVFGPNREDGLASYLEAALEGRAL